MSPAEGLRTALELFDLAVEMLQTRLRRDNPAITEPELAEAIRAWLHDRPGARDGDAVGRAATWPR